MPKTRDLRRRTDPERLRGTLPKWAPARIAVGLALIVGGILGFLPILGFWMIPLGLAVLALDFAPAKRGHRRLLAWIEARRRKVGAKR